MCVYIYDGGGGESMTQGMTHGMSQDMTHLGSDSGI